MAVTIARLHGALKAHPLIAGFIAALIPLVILLVQQFSWLTELDRASSVAHQASLRSFLSAVTGAVENEYRATAERVLNVPSDHFAPFDRKKIAQYWCGRPRAGIRTLFAVDFTVASTGNFYTFVPEDSTLVSSTASDESLAVVLAALPWQMRAAEAGLSQPPTLHVNEHDSNHRVVLKPVVGQGLKLLGVVGFVIDETYVRSTLLQRVIDEKLGSVFSDDVRQAVTISVRDGQGQPVLGEVADGITSPLAFVLKDWRIGIDDSGFRRPAWAPGTFLYNVTIGLVLAVVILFGLGLALSTASHAMHLSRMKSDFVSNVSHELRTPLCSIRLFAEFLKLGRARSPDKVIEYGEYIERESRRLSRLIDNILDFSKIESQRRTYRRTPTDLRALVETVVHTVDPPLDGHPTRVRAELPREAGPVVSVDADAIAQALHNLLDNATKYSENDDEIVVRLCPCDDHVIISVQDHGIGIAKHEQARVFERFHRVSTGLVHDVKGCGLGLSLVQHTAQAHGGRVELDSEIGVGSTFSLWLPTAVESDHAQPAGR